MKFLFDLHTHSIVSGHAYSTLKENIEAAKERGLLAYGLSDHSYKMEGACHLINFLNFGIIPEEVSGVKVLMGIELNILDYEGHVDATEVMFERLDYMIASMHINVMKPGSLEENMTALEAVLENPKIKIIGHPDDGRYPLDYDRLAKRAAETNTVLELNDKSLSASSFRINGNENIRNMLEACRKYKTKIIVNSDAHFYCHVGNLERARRLLEEIDFPEDQVINTKLSGLKYVLNDSPRLKNFADKFWES